MCAIRKGNLTTSRLGRNAGLFLLSENKNDYKDKEAQMKKCTVCGKQVDRLNYGDLKIREITQIEVLGEKVKSKNTTLNLTLCKDCRTEISGEIVKRVLERKEVGCSGKCAECDGARI